MKWRAALLIGFLSVSCKTPEPVEKGVEAIKRIMGLAFQKTEIPVASPTPMDPASMAKANAEILMEMIMVTFHQKDVLDQDQFQSLLSSLNQGASFEGIYRGLVLGSRYRVLESKGKAASPLALKFFALEMADLQLSMKNPTRFDPNTAKNLPEIDYPEGDDGGVANQSGTSEGVADEAPKLSRMELTESILQTFIGATQYTLKRVLAEEALKKIEELSESRVELTRWYASLVAHLSQSNVDFGLPLRNDPNSLFHQQFAQTVSKDRVIWEVLNRYHRILNSMN
jgi:hypothetical protein